MCIRDSPLGSLSTPPNQNPGHYGLEFSINIILVYIITELYSTHFRICGATTAPYFQTRSAVYWARKTGRCWFVELQTTRSLQGQMKRVNMSTTLTPGSAVSVRLRDKIRSLQTPQTPQLYCSPTADTDYQYTDVMYSTTALIHCRPNNEEYVCEIDESLQLILYIQQMQSTSK